MALDSKTLAATALHCFGFGPRAGSIASVAADPRGAMLAELDRPGAGRIADSDLLTTGEAARAAFDFRQRTEGYVTLLFFGYTSCPDQCPMHMANLSAALKKMPAGIADQVKHATVKLQRS